MISQNKCEKPKRIAAKLNSFLHFRQWKLPELENWRKIEVRNYPIITDLRQVVASNRGKELLQVTRFTTTAAARVGVVVVSM